MKEETEPYQPLFELIEEKFGAVLLQSEMDEIADACKPLYEPELDLLRQQNAELVEALKGMLNVCLSGDETRLCLVAIGGSNVYAELHKRCDNIAQAFIAAHVAISKNQPQNPADVDEL